NIVEPGNLTERGGDYIDYRRLQRVLNEDIVGTELPVFHFGVEQPNPKLFPVRGLLGFSRLDVVESRLAGIRELLLQGRIHQLGDNGIAIAIQFVGAASFSRSNIQEVSL